MLLTQRQEEFEKLALLHKNHQIEIEANIITLNDQQQQIKSNHSVLLST
jgi:hypothetical protein